MQGELFSAAASDIDPAKPWLTEVVWSGRPTLLIGRGRHQLDEAAKRIEYELRRVGPTGATLDQLVLLCTHPQDLEADAWSYAKATTYVYRAWHAGRCERVFVTSQREHRYIRLVDPDGYPKDKPSRIVASLDEGV